MNRQQNQNEISLNEQVIKKIILFVRNENLAPGSLLPPETVLASQLNVSRVALREALCYFKALGLMSSKRGSGVRIEEPDLIEILERIIPHITNPNTSGMNELFALRRTLELGNVADAVKYANAEQIQYIRQKFEEYKQIANRTENCHHDINCAELNFHCALMAPADCRILKIINILLQQFFSNRNELFSEVYFHSNNLKRFCREHELIVLAYENKLPEAAYLALYNHLSHSDLQ